MAGCPPVWNEEHPAAGGDAPRAHVRDQAGHRPARVHRVEQQRLAARRQRQRVAHRVVEPAVARREHGVAHRDVACIERVRALDHRRQPGGDLLHAGALPPGVPPHADALHRRGLAQRPQAHEDARVGEPAARGAHDGVEPDAERPRLRRDLLGRDHVAQPAERRAPGSRVNPVRPAAGAGQRAGEALERRIRRPLVVADRKRMQRRAEQPVYQHVA